jgi:hypothetical protein
VNSFNFVVLQLASEVIEQDCRLPLLDNFPTFRDFVVGSAFGDKANFERAKGGFWREADIRKLPCRGSGIRGRVSRDRRSRKAREVRLHLVEDEQDVLRREV